jgi:hypothetical protein
MLTRPSNWKWRAGARRRGYACRLDSHEDVGVVPRRTPGKRLAHKTARAGGGIRPGLARAVDVLVELEATRYREVAPR